MLQLKIAEHEIVFKIVRANLKIFLKVKTT